MRRVARTVQAPDTSRTIGAGGGLPWALLALALANTLACAGSDAPSDAGGPLPAAGGVGGGGKAAVTAGDAAIGGSSGRSMGGAGAAPPVTGTTGGASGAGHAASAGSRASAGASGSGKTGSAGMQGSAGAGAPAGWKLTWSDEFDGAKGAKLDATKWVYETGGTGWGNNQLEFDTDRAQNAALDGNGELTITAIKESYMSKDYTSVRLNTQGKFDQLYGRFEVRMQIPFGQGMWPAFWMMGVDPNNVGWPARGEIDIMENIGKEPDTIHGTIHGPGYSGSNGIGAPSKLAMGQRFADDYHVYAVEWEENVIRWYVDDTLYETRTPADLPKGTKWVYDHPFFILLNLAIGGQWPGNPDSTTMFPQTMKVDYVRVYSR